MSEKNVIHRSKNKKGEISQEVITPALCPSTKTVDHGSPRKKNKDHSPQQTDRRRLAHPLVQVTPLDAIPDSEAGAGIPFRPIGAPESSPGTDVAVSLSAMALARATGSSGRTSAMLSSCVDLADVSNGVRVAHAVAPWDAVARFRQEAGKAHSHWSNSDSGPNPGIIPRESETVNLFFVVCTVFHRQPTRDSCCMYYCVRRKEL